MAKNSKKKAAPKAKTDLSFDKFIAMSQGKEVKKKEPKKKTDVTCSYANFWLYKAA